MTTQTQGRYPIQAIASTASAAQPLLASVEKAFRYVPNTLGVMANAPTTLKAYLEYEKSSRADRCPD